MNYTTVISAQTLKQNLNTPHWIIIDCRFSLPDTEAGAKAYRFGHIPGARYAHLDKDLSSRITDFTGRHPLPSLPELLAKLNFWGISNQSQVILYDDASGVFASRFWWLLHHLGHSNAAVLDGGIKPWLQLGYPTTTHLPQIKASSFRPYSSDYEWVNAEQVQNGLAKKSIVLVDARTPDRFRGNVEPIDKVAGHIPGAVNRPFNSNLDPEGLFLAPNLLKQQLQQTLGDSTAGQVVHMCGSGVTACHNLLAMEIAGLHGSKLYAGSWSDWIRNKNRPVAAIDPAH